MKKVFIFLFLGLSCFIFAEYIEQSYFFDQYTIRQQSEYDLIIMKNTQLHAPAGEPLLPYHSVILHLPTGKKAARIEIILEDETIIGSDHLLLPKQPSKPLSDNSPSDFMINESVYESSAIYPQKNIDVFSTQYFRGHPIVISTFTPFRYIPANGFLRFFKQVTLRVYLQPEDRRSLPADNSESTLQKLTDYVQNPHQISYFPENRPNDETEILIITGAQFENSFQELSEVNLKRGFFTQVISVNTISQTMPGLDDQEKIRNYIKDKYLNNGLNHVLLAGDVEIVPYRGFYCYVQSGNGYESFDIPADLYYSALDGTWDDNGNGIWGEIGEEDLLPEISVARLPFSDQSELDKMLNKAISYQIQPVLGELDRTLLAGENLYNNPLTWGGDYLDLLIGYQNENGYETTGIPIDDDYLTMYDRDLGNWSGSDLINEINLGHPFIHHSGHSNYNYGMRLNMSDITNYNFSGANGIDHNFTLIYSHGCNAGGFDQSDCIAEQMLKIDNFAAAYIGSSRYGWFNEGQTEGPSAHLNREFVDALYNSQINLLGEINSDSKIDTAPWVTAPGQWEEATLCYFSKTNDENTNKETTYFFWGYRIHIIVDAENDTPLTFKLAKNNKKDFDVAIPLYTKLVELYPELYQSKLAQLADKGYFVKKVFETFHLYFDGKSFIPENKKNSKDEPIEIPTCKNELKMKFDSLWYEEKQDRFRVRFKCPLSKPFCNLKTSDKKGCTRTFQVRKPFPGEVQQHSPTFQKIYPKRQAVERVNAFLQHLGWENPKCYSMKAIENIVGFALMGKSLKSFL